MNFSRLYYFWSCSAESFFWSYSFHAFADKTVRGFALTLLSLFIVGFPITCAQTPLILYPFFVERFHSFARNVEDMSIFADVMPTGYVILIRKGPPQSPISSVDLIGKQQSHSVRDPGGKLVADYMEKGKLYTLLSFCLFAPRIVR